MLTSSSSGVTESSATVSKPLVSRRSSNSCDTPDKFWMRISSSSSTSGSEADAPEEDDDEEILIQNLSGVSQELLDLLETNGFETVAELSITPLDELIAIDGIDEESGKNILKKVNQQLGNAGNA